jgi:hypothetical protein
MGKRLGPAASVGGRRVGVEGQGTGVEGRGTRSGVDRLSGAGVAAVDRLVVSRAAKWGHFFCFDF